MRIHSTYILFFFLALLYQGKGFSMVSPEADSNLLVEDTYNEKYELITDRNIYAVGEKIYFKAFNISPANIKKAFWSKVLYVQLINQNGTSVENGKFELSRSGSHGFIVIPENLLTGNYYLIAYTKWMRNFSSLQYDYLGIKIINPYLTEIEGTGQGDTSGTIPERGRMIPEQQGTMVICKTDKSKYRQGEEVGYTIRLPQHLNFEPSRVTAVACRPGAIDTLHQAWLISDKFESPKSYNVNFLPDIRGLSIGGKIVLKNSDEPVKDARVELSILGKPHRFFVYDTKQDGKFYFALDSISGDYELFIASRHKQYPELDINIDKDFSDFPPGVFQNSFELSASEKILAREIMINMQAEKMYKTSEPTIQSNPDTGSERTAFYDIPLHKLMIDEYIELPNLKEVFIELVPEVISITRRNKTSLYLTGNTLTAPLMQDMEPLILLDQLPVNDLEKLYVLSPKRIQSIEVLNEIYVLGNTLYGGVINIISKNGDMAGMDLPANSFFFPYTGFLPHNVPGNSVHQDKDSDIPDFRNFLTWEPDIVLTPGESGTFHFNTSDRSGRYMLLIRGFTESGTYLQGITYFDVE